MNAQRRKAIAELNEQLYELLREVGELRGQEEDYFDNMPESLQYSERGEKAEEAIQALQDAMDSIEEAMNSLDYAAEQ